MKTLKIRATLERAERSSPHPPLVFKEDSSTESPTHMETSASSSDEGSKYELGLLGPQIRSITDQTSPHSRLYSNGDVSFLVR